MSDKKYPEEIYPNVNRGATYEDIEKAYDLGLRDGAKEKVTLDGFSNLTEALHNGTRIDWNYLEGRTAKCVHRDIGTLTYYMERDSSRLENRSSGWWADSNKGGNLAWGQVFTVAWEGGGGWSLWIEGDIPVKKRTADELEPATGFFGRYKSTVADCFVYLNNRGEKCVYDVTNRRSQRPEKVEVLQVCGIGTLQPSKEKV